MKKYILKLEENEFWKYAESLEELIKSEKKECKENNLKTNLWIENKSLIIEEESDLVAEEDFLKLQNEKIKKIKNTDFNSVTSVKNIIPILKDLIELL